jgi:hypothetical protein
MTTRPGLTQAESDAVDHLLGRAQQLRGDATNVASAADETTVGLSAWDRLTAAVERWESVKAESAPTPENDDLRGLYWPPTWSGPGTPLGIPG